MTRHRLMYLSLLLSVCFVLPSHAQEPTPTHVCPQWNWGNTGSIFHWYSEYVEVRDDSCTSIKFDNYDGAEVEPTGGSCGSLGGCRELPKVAQLRASRELAKNGLSEPPDPSFEPNVSEAVTIVQKKIVDVKITPTKVIKVKLYLNLIDPRVVGRPFPPIFVASGFEVQYDPQYPPFMTLPNASVTRLEDNTYDMKIGQVTYRVITHEEEGQAAQK